MPTRTPPSSQQLHRTKEGRLRMSSLIGATNSPVILKELKDPCAQRIDRRSI